MEGWIKLYRKFMDWEWYDDSHTVHLFIHLLLNANSQPGKWRGIKVERGQLIAGRHTLSEDTGISERAIRTCLNRLKTTGEIAIKTTNKNSIITIIKYDSYQVFEKMSDQQTDQQTDTQATSKRPAIDHKQEYKEEREVKKKEEELKARSLIFKNQILEFKNQYSPIPTLKEFYEYWSEPNKSKTKMRFELQQTWDLSRRLSTWVNREGTFRKNGNSAPVAQTPKITETPINEIR